MIIRVVGMPRSGTAFVSMLFQLHPDILSYHEMAHFDGNWKKTLTYHENDVVVDCNTYGFLPMFDIKCDSYVYIDYDAKDSALRSSIAIRSEVPITHTEEVRRQGLIWAKKNNALILSRDEVFSLHGLRKIWVHTLGGNVEFPDKKVKEMLKLNIQHHNPERFKKCTYEPDGTTGAYCLKCGRGEWLH